MVICPHRPWFFPASYNSIYSFHFIVIAMLIKAILLKVKKYTLTWWVSLAVTPDLSSRKSLPRLLLFFFLCLWQNKGSDGWITKWPKLGNSCWEWGKLQGSGEGPRASSASATFPCSVNSQTLSAQTPTEGGLRMAMALDDVPSNWGSLGTHQGQLQTASATRGVLLQGIRQRWHVRQMTVAIGKNTVKPGILTHVHLPHPHHLF